VGWNWRDSIRRGYANMINRLLGGTMVRIGVSSRVIGVSGGLGYVFEVLSVSSC